MIQTRHVRRRRSLAIATAVAAISFAAAAAAVAPARSAAAGGPVNVTLNIPADVRPNPCVAGDMVNVSGTLHIVYYTSSDNAGGFRIDQHVDEIGSGKSLTTSVGYQFSDNYEHSFYARPPFPAAETQTHTVNLVSQGTTPNLIMGYTLHTTVNAAGIPTATVDNVRLDCTG